MVIFNRFVFYKIILLVVHKCLYMIVHVVASLSSLLLHVILSSKVVYHILEWISWLRNQDKCKNIIIKRQGLHVTFIEMNKETVIYKWLYGNYPCNTTLLPFSAWWMRSGATGDHI